MAAARGKSGVLKLTSAFLMCLSGYDLAGVNILSQAATPPKVEWQGTFKAKGLTMPRPRR